VITNWSAVSPFGLGAAAFADGVLERRPAIVRLKPDPAEAGAGHAHAVTPDGGRAADRAHQDPSSADSAADPPPMPTAALVPSFDARTALGAKNTRSMDRATALAVTAVGLLLDRPSDDAGLVLGTGNGSVRSMMDFTRDSMTMQRPYHVDPARFPNTVMNCAAGRCAIWHGLHGPNTTIAGGHASGLLALNYAARLRSCGHAETVLCGAVEEYSAYRAWLEWHAHADCGARPLQPLGEGCAVFLLESPEAARDGGRRVHAALLALEFGVAGNSRPPQDALADCLRAALNEAGARPADVWAAAPAGYRDERGTQELAALTQVLGPGPRVLPPVGELIGDTSAASSAFQLAALLAEAARDPAAAGRVGAVTTVDREGLVGCVLLQLR
jgi:3-oxoacyl-[acyl-carrier-protein] synthase II